VKSGIAIVLLLAGVLTSAQKDIAQTTQADHSRLTGVWRGQMNDLPALTLVVTDEGGGLSGAVLFYFLTRKTENDPWTSTPGLPEPVLHLRVEGDTISFDVSHRRAHPPRTLNDPPVHFHLRLTAPNQSELVNESEHSPAFILTRSEY